MVFSDGNIQVTSKCRGSIEGVNFLTYSRTKISYKHALYKIQGVKLFFTIRFS